MSVESLDPLIELGRLLVAEGYRFVTSTPRTHGLLLARDTHGEARSLRDVFGFSRPFAPTFLPPAMREALRAAGMLEQRGSLLASTVRWSTLGGALYVHSSYPTTEADSVFFGPDTYRFVAFLQANLRPAKLAVDIGCGTGAGGLSIASKVAHMALTDVNRLALRFARVNARLAGIENASVVEADVMTGVEGAPDLIVANPPYIIDDAGRAYRHGGDNYGAALSIRIVRESLPRLAPGGTLLVYTGSAIVDGRDAFMTGIEPFVRDFTVQYTELDPDVFGEELERPAYREVERIAVVGLRVEVP